MVRLTEKENLKQDIEAKREAIRMKWIELDRMVLTPRQKQKLRNSVSVLARDLAELLAKLEKLDAKRP